MTLAAPLLLAALATTSPAADATSPAAGPDQKEALEPLMDNSFLIEEAYNQEAGVVQNIFTFTRDRASGTWVASYTNEWPVPGQTHQLSYTLTYARDGAPGGEHGLSDVLLNYRYQAIFKEPLAVSPRLSAVIPGAAADTGIGYRGFGLQAMLPISVELTPWLVTHVNLGGTWVPDGKSGAQRAAWSSITAGQSFIWLVTPRLNLMAEAVWSSTDRVVAGLTSRAQTLTVSPGVRWGLDLPGDVQVVLGAAVPLGVGPSAGDRAFFAYFSVELPYWHPAEEAHPPAAPAAAR